jgi:hypothetical protein
MTGDYGIKNEAEKVEKMSVAEYSVSTRKDKKYGHSIL